jgi:hypothetical protein
MIASCKRTAIYFGSCKYPMERITDAVVQIGPKTRLSAGFDVE